MSWPPAPTTIFSATSLEDCRPYPQNARRNALARRRNPRPSRGSSPTFLSRGRRSTRRRSPAWGTCSAPAGSPRAPRSGPSRQALSEHLRRAAGAGLQLGHLHHGDRPADRRRRAGRRGDHDAALLGRDQQRRPRGRGPARLRRHRPGDADDRPGPGRGGRHARGPAPSFPVDLAGLPVDRDRLHALAARHRLRVIEDAAQSIGSTWKGRRIGSFGDFVSFSFHANKNITTSEGGCLVLNTERRGQARRAVPAPGRRPDRPRRHGGRAGGRKVQHDRRRGADRPRPASAPGRVHGPAPRAGPGLLRGAATGPASGRSASAFRRSNFTDSNWHMFQVMLPEERLGMTRGRGHGGAARRGNRHGRPLPGDPPLLALPAARLEARATSRMPSTPAATSSRCPLFPAMSRADVAPGRARAGGDRGEARCKP